METFTLPEKRGNYLVEDCEYIFDLRDMSGSDCAFKRLGEVSTKMISRMLGGLPANIIPNKGFVALWSDDDCVFGFYQADFHTLLVKVSFANLYHNVYFSGKSFSERLCKIAGLYRL